MGEITSTKKKAIIRQFMVSAGVSLSMMEHSLVSGYTTVLLPQLRTHKDFKLDDSSASWIASIVGLANTVGILCVPALISRHGRRSANLVSALLMVLGWLCIVFATSTRTILIARFIQGIGLGISSLTSAILIAEYTTPKYRGAFLTMMSVALISGSLIVHALGSCISWIHTAYFCLAVAITDSILVTLSPESPVFLVTRSKYDKCRKVFHWLRGFDEEEELEAMIKVDILNKAITRRKSDLKEIIKKIFVTLKTSEFYKPLIIMLHLNLCNAFCGSVMLDVYGVDIFHVLIGNDVNIVFMLVSMDIVRIASSLLAAFLNSNIKRRHMIVIFISLNILVYFITAVYHYAKAKHWLSSDDSLVGAGLVYLLMFSVGVGTLPVANIISGEIFPLKFKNVSAMLTTFCMCFSISLKLKTLPYMVTTMGLHGAYIIYGLIMLYGMVISLLMLPETKDLTLQNIEESNWKKQEMEDLTKLEEINDLVSDRDSCKQRSIS